LSILGVIGGSGLYQMPGLEEVEEFDIRTPFGAPSAPILVGRLEGEKVAFLARHGIGHHISPSEINFRANIFALKLLDVDRIVSISACGSLREDYAPGEVVIPDQLFDFTRGRERTFFGDGLVVHVNVADPFCPNLSQDLFEAVHTAGAHAHRGGAFITIEGPRFSTKAESNTYRTWGLSLIGMTTCPEAFLAREAEICYSVMAHVTDYDVWHLGVGPVTVDQVIQVLNRNIKVAQDALRNLVRQKTPSRPDCACNQALSGALITSLEAVPQEIRERLRPLIQKYI
jgi:5'-methylthioadenosine phosphorylase